MPHDNPYEEAVASQTCTTEKSNDVNQSQMPRLSFTRNRLVKPSRWKLGLGLILLGLVGLNCMSALAALGMQLLSGIGIAAALTSMFSGLTLSFLSIRTSGIRYRRNR